MQTSTRIGIALCLLVAGVTLAGLFRKSPDEAAAPADASEGGVALRQPDQVPFLAANGSGGWRSKPGEAAKPPKDQRPSAAGAAAKRGPAAPPLPLLAGSPEGMGGLAPSYSSLPKGAPSDAASSDAATSRGTAPVVILPGSSPVLGDRSSADDDWQLHEVVDGDTLRALAQRYFGDPSLAEAIRRENAALIRNSDILPIGAFLKIPSRSRVRSTTAERPGNAAAGWRKAHDGRP